MTEEEKKILTTVAAAVKKTGGRLLFAGGYVRNYLMGLNSQEQDLDLEAFGLQSQELAGVLSAFGPVKKVGKSFPILKIAGYPRWDFSVPVDPGASFAEACSRRDFTVNSMLMDVLTDQIIDLYGGKKDLQNRTIRHSERGVFSADPLRVYRAAGLAARLHFSVAAETMELMKQVHYDGVSPDRIYRELRKLLLLAPRPSAGLRILQRSGALKKLHPRLHDLVGCRQSDKNHPEGDVWEHTIMVVDQAAQLRADSQDPEVYMMAALLHDIGKPEVSRLQEGKIIAYGHDIKGADLAGSFLAAMGAGDRVSTQAAILVREHMQPVLLYKQRDRVGDAAIRRLMNRVNVQELLLLSEADYNGRGIRRNYQPIRDWLIERISRLGLEPGDRIEPVVKGRDLISLGFRPDKKFSPMLQYAYELQLLGKSKDQILEQVQIKFPFGGSTS